MFMSIVDDIMSEESNDDISAKNVNLHDKFLVFQEISCVHLFTFANEQCRADKFLKIKRHG